MAIGISGFGPIFSNSFGGTFSPKSISGLQWWLRGDNGITLSTGVANWNDQSGTGDTAKNFAQSTGAKQPTYNTSDSNFNNKSTVSFDGAAQFMQNSGAWSSPVAAPMTFYLVASYGTSAAGYLIGSELVTSPNGVNWSAQNVAGTFEMEIVSSSTEEDVITGSDTHTSSIYCGIQDGASSELYVNNYAFPASMGTLSDSLGGTTMTLGCFLNTGTASGFETCTIAEVIAYTGHHNAATRAKVMNYLSKRYNISVSSSFSPSSLALTGWFEASFTGAPWNGSSSSGTSGSHIFSHLINDPAVGTAINGFTPATFTAASSEQLRSTSGSGFASYVSASAYTVCALINPTSTFTATGTISDSPCIFTDGNGIFGLAYDSNGATIFHDDGAYQTINFGVGTGAWALLMAYYDGSHIFFRVNNGGWSPGTTAGSITDTSATTVFTGTNWADSNFFNGSVLSIMTADTAISRTNLDNIGKWLQTRYALSLGF